MTRYAWVLIQKPAIGPKIFAWFSQGQEDATRMYVPKPKPLIADKGMVMIPVKDPVTDLMDGAMHKFSLVHEGQQMRIIVIRRWNNTLAAALDACEMCPPDGYGQRDDHVVCIYCGTPIPVNTLGLPGGCNPIPVPFRITNDAVMISLEYLIGTFTRAQELGGKGSHL